MIKYLPRNLAPQLTIQFQIATAECLLSQVVTSENFFGVLFSYLRNNRKRVVTPIKDMTDKCIHVYFLC